MTTNAISSLSIDRIGWLLIHSVWQFTVIALWLAAVLGLLRRAPVQLRYNLCLGGWALMLMAPAATWLVLPNWVNEPAASRALTSDTSPLHRYEGDSSVTASSAIKLAAITLGEDDRAISMNPGEPSSAATTAVGRWDWVVLRIAPWLHELVALWCLGVAVFAVRPGLSGYMVRQWKRKGASGVPSNVTSALERAKNRLGLCREVRVVQSALVKVPIVVGCLRPMILLPLGVVAGLSVTEIEAILAHELAHVRRHDYLVNLLQTLSETIFFYHPAMWWVSTCIRQEREHCCDEMAAQVLGSRAQYGRALLALDELRGGMPALSLAATGGSLLARIQRLAIVDSRAQSPGVSSMAMITLSIVLLSAVGFWMATGAGTPLAVATDESSNQAPVREADNRDDEPPAGVVRGTLVNAADGKPVAGARLILRGTKADRATSDAAGRFEFTNIAPDSRPYTIWAHAGNLIVPEAPLEPIISADGASARFSPVRLQMVEGKQVKFLVRSAVTGKPLPGAAVKFGYPDRREVATTALGTALVQGLQSMQYEVTVDAPGHAQQTLELDLSQPQRLTELRIELEAGGIVRGVAVDNDGKPVGGAIVYYYIRDSHGSFGDAQSTDPQGKFQHSYLPVGKPVKIKVQHDDFLRAEQEVVVTEETREQNVSVTLSPRPRGKSIRGMVTDEQGNGVPGARVVNDSGAPDMRREAVADSQGEFTLDDLNEGYTGYQIYVEAKTFVPRKLVVKPGTVDSPAAVDVTLKRGHRIRGRVVDESGQPKRGAHVVPRSNAYFRANMGESIQTDDEGRFAFDSLPEDARFDVSAPGYPYLQTALQLDGEEPVTLMLQAPGVLRGRVVDANTGEPVRQFRVQLGFSPITKPNDRTGGFNSSWSDPGMTFNSVDGKFLIKPLTNGMPLALTVLAENYERTVIERAVAAKQGEAEELPISLEPIDLSQRYTLDVRLLDGAGHPATGAQLRLIVSNSRPTGADDNRFNWVLIDSGQLGQKPYCDQFLSGVSDDEGRFEFKSILPGKHLQLAYWGKGVPRGRSLAFDETRPGESDTVEIKLPAPARIRGTIKRERFTNAGSIQLSLAGAAFQEYKSNLAEEQSSFDFDDLPPGEYWVSVGSKPVEFTENGAQFFRISPLASQKVQLQAGETKEVSFTEPDPKKE